MMEIPQPPTTPTYSALIVDDNFFNRDIFKIALEFAGYEVFSAENGEVGLDLLSKGSYTLLILDLQMPTMDGRAVLRNLKSRDDHKQMRIVVVTANAHMATEDIIDMADYVMFKPINIAEFSDFVKRIKTIPMVQ